MLLFYRLSLAIYWLIIRVLAPFHEKAAKFSAGRKEWKKVMQSALGDRKDKIVWFHAASLGEFEQGRPVIEKLKEVRPDLKVVLTFFSPSGYEIRKNYAQADWVFYLPIDSPKNARDFVRIVRPVMAVFIKYEYWYCYLKELHEKSIPILMVSAIFRENQFFFHPLGGFYRKALRWINHYFVQDKKSEDLIRHIGIASVETPGDTRFDRVLSIAQEAMEFDVLETFTKGQKTIVLGSTWGSDLDVVADFVKGHLATYKFIIAPHNIHKEEIEDLKKRFTDTVRYSAPHSLSSKRILIIDNMGMLSSVYKYADFAIIGGAFRGALHNTLEAAVYGIPVLFGQNPNNHKFKEAIDLINAGGAFTFSSAADLEGIFEQLTREESYKAAASSAGAFVHDHAGATDKVIKKMLELL